MLFYTDYKVQSNILPLDIVSGSITRLMIAAASARVVVETRVQKAHNPPFGNQKRK